MFPALIGKLADFIFLHVSVDELERRRRQNPDLVSTLTNLPVSEREKLRAKISHLHKYLNHASPTEMAEMLTR